MICDADFVLLDGNLPTETIRIAVEIADFYGTKVWYEPTDTAKMRKIFDANVADKIDITSPNFNEFNVYCQLINRKLPEEILTEWKTNEMFDYISENADAYLRTLETLIVTVGPKGSIVLKRDSDRITRHLLYAPLEPDAVVSASGAGDW
ncbi:unnamed protein product [Anisakis simplex]|uniref:PfkB domain-containing protein n=1 Tax=Anisakis simplex TaxID=6269 RepID=A0A0M3J2P3_ANISI|nr:unnamed protein product [Anisakis simplex]